MSRRGPGEPGQPRRTRHFRERGDSARGLRFSPGFSELTAMTDMTTTLATLKEAVRRFAAERAWEPFHSPKNLVMGLAAEAAELMEHFLWVDCQASEDVVHDPDKLAQVADEMADVAVYLLNLSNRLGIDLSDAIVAKIAKNAIKYPVEKYQGRYQIARDQGPEQ
jgi:NTP pyrophosphatase (non-canonical NTP hydrolase)